MSSSVEIQNLPSECSCPDQEYTRSDIQSACATALNLHTENKTVGRDKYPHTYNDYEHFNFSFAERPYIEFPILPDGQIYNGEHDESPEADRIVLGSIAGDGSTATFCAVITHDGSSKNGFTECKDDTVNPNGKGYGAKVSKRHHENHHGHREKHSREEGHVVGVDV